MDNNYRHPEQFFDIDISHYPCDNATTDLIHYYEWKDLKQQLNGHGFNPSDNSNEYHNNQTRRVLNRHLKTYLNNPSHIEIDFLQHLESMFEKESDFLLSRTSDVLESWLLKQNLRNLHNITKPTKNQGVKPIEFAENHWAKIKILIAQNDGNVSAAARQISEEVGNPPKDIKSLARAINRLCETRKVAHNKNI